MIPAASAAGTALSRKPLSAIAGRAGHPADRHHVLRQPAAFIRAKNVAPPSAEYRPVSSLAPKSTAPAVVVRVSAHRSAQAAVNRLKVPSLVAEVSCRRPCHRPRRGRAATPYSRDASTASSSRSAPKRTGSSAVRPVSASARAIAAPAASSERSACVQSDRRDPGLAGRQGDPLVQLDELGQRQQRVARIAVNLGRPCLVAEDEHVRCRAVDQAERHPGVGGMRDRALTLDEEQLSPALVTLDEEPLGRTRDEVRDDGVDGDSPACDRDPGLAGGDEARFEPARLRGPVELERDGHLSDRAVASRPSARFASPARGWRRSGRSGRPAGDGGRAARRRGGSRGRSAPRRRRETRAGRSRRSVRARSRLAGAHARPAGSGHQRWRRRRARSPARRRARPRSNRRSGRRPASPPPGSSRGSRRPAARRRRARRARSCRNGGRRRSLRRESTAVQPRSTPSPGLS